jgi:hypothetical protein
MNKVWVVSFYEFSSDHAESADFLTKKLEALYRKEPGVSATIEPDNFHANSFLETLEFDNMAAYLAFQETQATNGELNEFGAKLKNCLHRSAVSETYFEQAMSA